MTKRQFVNFRPYGKGERYAEQFRLLHGEPVDRGEIIARAIINLIGICAFVLGAGVLVGRAIA